MIKEYFRALWAALCNRPVYTPYQVIKEVQVVKDLSMSTADLEEARKVFPLERWKKGSCIEEFARSDGEQRVIQWFEKRIGARSKAVGKNRVL